MKVFPSFECFMHKMCTFLFFQKLDSFHEREMKENINKSMIENHYMPENFCLSKVLILSRSLTLTFIQWVFLALASRCSLSKWYWDKSRFGLTPDWEFRHWNTARACMWDIKSICKRISSGKKRQTFNCYQRHYFLIKSTVKQCRQKRLRRWTWAAMSCFRIENPAVRSNNSNFSSRESGKVASFQSNFRAWY